DIMALTLDNLYQIGQLGRGIVHHKNFGHAALLKPLLIPSAVFLYVSRSNRESYQRRVKR
ncbi:MAG: hypothetical protein ACPH5V_02285, partial [Alcanivorax sp.]